MERSVIPKLRAGLISALALPFGLAAFAAALSSGDPPLEIMAPILALVVCVLAVCWSRVAAHRQRRNRGRDDDDEPWRRDGGDDDPLDPDGGAGGPVIDWPAFERDFAAYVRACEDRPDRPLTPAG